MTIGSALDRVEYPSEVGRAYPEGALSADIVIILIVILHIQALNLYIPTICISTDQ